MAAVFRSRLRRMMLIATAALGLLAPPRLALAEDDPYLWLEDIDGPRSMAWVTQHNALTAQRLEALPQYAGLYRDAMAALDSTSRIPEVDQRGQWLYSLWQDAAHPLGLWRRATLAEFRKTRPRWETLIDLDALAQREGTRYAFGGADFRADNRRVLVGLAPGGGDTAELREFDVESKAFVADGFRLPAAKSRASWRDDDSLYVATDFGPGSLTRAGYPRVVKTWHRGTPLASATLLYEASVDSISAAVQRIDEPGGASLDLLTDELTFWTSRRSLLVAGRAVPLELPPTAIVSGSYQGKLVIWLKADWSRDGHTWPAGAVLLAAPAVLEGQPGQPEAVFLPGGRAIVQGVNATRAGILLTFLDDVRGRLARYRHDARGWHRSGLPFPDNGSIKVVTADEASGDAVVQYESFLTPPSLWQVPAAPGARPRKLKSQSATFDAAGFEVTQHQAVSADGTRVPFFVVGSKHLRLDGGNPVWMFSYGGFEESLQPSYSGSYEDMHGAYGKMWLARGGVFVLANIRGGGEFGPAWHTAALRADHVKAFEDFEAVAAALDTLHIASPRHIGIEGRSNGGLLVSSTMLRHPELYGAVVCGNPLTDMQRYNKLLAGASWEGEYGNPDKPEDWAFISQYSPYQRVKPGLALPPVMFYSTTRDDRVHPAHARKMAARMEDEGYPVLYSENIEGGHHGPVVAEQLATRIAQTFTFLWAHVGRDAGR